MKTILVPGVGWPSAPIEDEKIREIHLKRGGRKAPILEEEVRLIREMRGQGRSLLDLQKIFKRGKITVISIIVGKGRYAKG